MDADKMSNVVSILKVLAQILGYVAAALAGSACSGGCAAVPVFNF